MPDAVLITGVYGSGKSSVGQEIANILEARDVRFALLDLDFLSWGYPGGEGLASEQRMLLKNLTAVVANYLAVGVRRFILAGLIRDRSELEGLRAELPMRLRVVRLTVGLQEIERRLSSDATTARKDDLRHAGEQIAASLGVGIEDLALSNERPIREVALDIVQWLGWRS
jgi:Adenylylsulphate kinase